MTVLAGDIAGEAFEAFLGGLPNLEGPGPSAFRKDGAGVASFLVLFYGFQRGGYSHEADDGYDFVFFSIFLLGEAFFLPAPLSTPSFARLAPPTR